MSVLVVGSMAFDSIETPHGRADRVLGGSAAYFALAAAVFAPVRIVGVVGEDFPEEHLTALSRSGVDLEGLQRAAGKTFFWHGRYHEDLNVRDTLEVQLNVLGDFDPRLPAGYEDTEYVFLGNMHPAAQSEVLSQLKQPRLVACDTMDHWINENPGELRKVLERVETVVINDSEARMLSGHDNIVRAARAILKMGPRAVLIKRGEYGVFQFSDDSTFVVPAYPLEDVLDPTGAGDSFAGAFMGCLAAGGANGDEGLRRAIVYGNVTASFTVEDFGPRRLLTLERGEVDERYRRFVELTRFHD
ncbi:MAG: PfkB family carbohydrate kinase [Deltaproteobacteria bacterium]|nr:PfkB family carbohydrate kinase [Deltaproteobacteria bacterium]